VGIVKLLILIIYLLAVALEDVNILLEGTSINDFLKYDLEKIVWIKKSNYEKAIEQDSHDFKALINDLEAHEGKLQRNGFFMWLFSDSKTVGRKKQNIRWHSKK